MKQQVTTKMMMAAGIIISTFASCKKATVNYVQPPIAVEVSKIKSLDYGTSTRLQEYDSKGRATKYTYSSGAKTDITYMGNTMTIESYHASGALAQRDISILNSDGLIISATNNNNIPLVVTYSYDSDRRLIKQTNTENGVVTRQNFYEYSNGNRVKDSISSSPLSWYTNKYEYYTDINSSIENINFGVDYYGVGNKNVLKKVIYQESGGTMNTKTYTLPEKDMAGRIIKMTYSLNGGIPVVYQYTYY